MANDLASYTDGVELLVDDTSNARYTTNQIAQALRAILVDYSTAKGITHTIKDLDSASATSIPTTDAGMVQMGGAGYALLTRAASQAEANVLQGDASDELRAIGESYLEAFYVIFDPKRSKAGQALELENRKAESRSAEIEQTGLNAYALQELKGQQALNNAAARRAQNILAEYRRSLGRVVKSGGAVLPAPPTDTF